MSDQHREWAEQQLSTKRGRLAGHALPNEGRLYRRGWMQTIGPAQCSCRMESSSLTSDHERRKWHREHKISVLVGQARRGAATPEVFGRCESCNGVHSDCGDA